MKSTRTRCARARARARAYGALRIPGLSLLDQEIVGGLDPGGAGRVLVRCPSCNRSRTFTVRPGAITDATFVHTTDCAIGRRVETVLGAVRAAEAAEAN
jgi:hypothetical protein